MLAEKPSRPLCRYFCETSLLVVRHQLGREISGGALFPPCLIPRNMRLLARSCFFGVAFLGSVREKLVAKFRTLLARFKKPEREYYPADYPDDWTL